MTSTANIICGDALEQLRLLPDASVHMCVTSPPYWNLRNYSMAGQMGMEKTPSEYVAAMVRLFREVGRVMRADGTLWLNIGDSYARNGGVPGGGNRELMHMEGTQSRMLKIPAGCNLKSKDLCLIPERLAIAMQDDGWYVRSRIAWCKKSSMPESVTDRPSSAWEHIWLLSRSEHYFYDLEAVKTPPSESFLNDARWKTGSTPENEKNGYADAGAQNPKSVHRMFDKQRGHSRRHAGFNDRWDLMTRDQQCSMGANLRNYWLLGPEPFADAHFATFPSEIPKRAILAGTSAHGACSKCGAQWVRITESTKSFQSGSGRSGNEINGKQDMSAEETNSTPDVRMGPVISTKTIGWEPSCACEGLSVVPPTVLDCFGGSGTTGMVALELGRNAILLELNPAYVKIAEKRTHVTPGLQLA